MRTLLLLALSVAYAAAVPVTVLNPSFEIATLPMTFATGSVSNLVTGTIPLGGTVGNWTAFNAPNGNNVGAFAPNAAPQNWTTPWWTGSNVGYMQNYATGTTSGGLTQTLSTTYQADTVYTLTVDIGRRQFQIAGSSFGYALELWAGSTLVGTASHLNLPLNSFGTDSLTATVATGSAAIGQNIEVRLLSNGVFSEAYFDNIRLDATAAPEPGTCALLGIAFSALALLRHRRAG